MAYWVAAATLAVLGLRTLFGAFGSSEFTKVLSYTLIGMAIVLYTARWIVLRRRAHGRN